MKQMLRVITFTVGRPDEDRRDPRLARKALTSVAIAAFLTTLGGAAQAQISPYLRGQPHLNADDLQLMDEAARKIYALDAPSPGQLEKWGGEASGNSGTVKLRRVLVKKSMPCRALTYDIHFKESSQNTRYLFTWCHTQDGTWKIAG